MRRAQKVIMSYLRYDSCIIPAADQLSVPSVNDSDVEYVDSRVVANDDQTSEITGAPLNKDE